MNYAGKFDAAPTLDGQGVRSPADSHVESFSAKSFTAKAHGHVPDGAVVIADPNLIFHGEFKRAGLDLVLSRDGHDFVVHDYFRGDKRAAIASPDGAHLTGDIVSALTGYVQVAQAAPGAAAAQVIGHVTKLTGSATVVRNGVSVILNNGDNVEKGDVVSTGSDSTLGITFIDGTVFGLSSNARMVLNEMVYDPNGSNNSSLLSLVAGTITFVAGETAKHGDMKIDTPVATMGIRGTAVLTEINFVVPAGGGDPQPQANFQVLVEPNGTTGSYILFDKLTLLPIATVNQAGQMIQISGGNVSVTNALLSPDVQKLINDVFTLKFTDNNTNTKLTNNSTDTITQDGNIVLIKTTSDATATATFTTAVNGNAGGPVQGGADKGIDRIPGPPLATSLDANGNVTPSFSLTEHAKATGDRLDATGDPVGPDILIVKINFLDQNLGDRPTVSVDVAASKYTYTDSGHHDVTASLSALQKRDIAATQVKISVAADAGNNNNGSATLTYTVPDHAFDFLADGETLTLTYIVSVDNNFAVNPETTRIPITITVTGTNDKPVITTSVPTIVFSGGTSVPGGPLTTNVPTSGTLTFTDVDLNDTHTASVKLTSASLPDGTSVPPGPLATFQNAMSVAIASGLDSTGTGTGTINWSLADLPVYLADFIPKGEVLTLVYTVTVADEHNATSQQTITVTITGTDAPAVVWIATNQPSGGFWKDAANWETGTVPTSKDDVIVITDQLHGLTPSYPVTIDVAAFGKSLTMDDYDTTVHHTAPQVINHSTLTLGGKLTLNADAKFTNAADGIVVVGGAIDVETITRPNTGVVVTNTAAISNAGTLTLDAGGVIDTLTTIVNSGSINLFGGTLTLDTGIANAGGTLRIGSFATLVANAVTIDGGTVDVSGTLELDGISLIENGTLNNSGAVDVKGAVEFAGETVANNGGGLIEIFAHDTLTLDHGSRVNNSGNVKVDASSKLAVNGATIDGGAITIIVGTPVFDDDEGGSSVFTFAPGLSTGTVTNNGELDLSGNAVFSNGILKNNGVLDSSGTSNALNGEMVTNAGLIEVLTGSLAIGSWSTVDNSSGSIIVDAALTLNSATLSGGDIKGGGSIDVTGASRIDKGAALTVATVIADAKLTLDGITVSGSFITDNASIELDDAVKLQGGAKIQGGPVTNNGTLEIAGAATLSNDVVTNKGVVKVDGSQTLTLSGTEISGGTINGTGTIDVAGASKIDGGATLSTSAVTVEAGTTLTLDIATVDGATISDKGSITLGGTVKLTGGAVIKGVSSVFAPNGGSPATAEFNWGQLGTSYTTLGSPQQVVATDGTDGTVSSAGGVFMRLDQSSGWSGNFTPGTHLLWDQQNGPDITIKFAAPVSSAGAQIQADYYGSFTAEIIAYDLGGNVIGTVTENGVSNGNSDGSAIFIDLISSSADIAMVKFMLTSATYLPNDFAIGPVQFSEGPSVGGSGPIVNNGTLEIEGPATLLDDIVTNHGTVTVDPGQTLTLTGSEISGGSLAGTGTIDVTGASAIDGGATLSTSSVTVETDQALMLDKMTVDGTVITDKGSIELDNTVKLQGGAKIQGGPVANNGTLEVAGAATLLNDIVTNIGTVQVDDGKLLTLSGTEISGGTINIYSGLSGGTIAVTGDSTIDGNATLNKGVATIASDITLKFDDATVSASKITNSGTVKVEADKKLALAGATLTGGALTIVGTLTSSGATTVTDANISNSYLLESTLGGLLTLVATSSTPVISNAGGTIRANSAELDIISEAVTNTGTLAAINDGTLKLISTKVTNTGGAVSIESGSTFDLSGATVNGGTVTIAGTLESTGTSGISNADITNTGTISVTGGTLTIDPVVVHALTNHKLLQANGGELDVSGEQIVNTKDIQAINGGILKLSGLGVTNDGGTVTVDGTSKLYLTAASINGGSLSNSGNLYGVSGLNTISAGISNTGTIEAQAGTLNLSGGLTGAGSLVIDDGATLELAGATAQIVTFAGGADTLQLDKVVGQSFTGTITGQSSTGGTFTVTGAADITTSSGDALDFTASGSTSLKPANIVLTPTGTLTGAASGIVVVQNGTGVISLTATKDIMGLAGNGIMLRDSASGVGDITIDNLTGAATGTGADSEGILVENLNAANAGDISITQLGGATGDAYGIDATTHGNGDVSIDAGGNITGSSIYGIRARSYGSGDITVTTAAGSVVTSRSSGVVAVNRSISLDASDGSTITVNAHGSINSGNSLNHGGNPPAGIQAGYAGSTNGSAANTDVNGTVVVNNYANITAGAGSGINAYNYGNGNVTVTSFAGTTISTSGTQSYGIEASALSGGTGGITVTLDTSVTISGATAYGIKAYSIDAGDITVALATGDSITSDSSGIVAVNYATAIESDLDSTISVEAHGTIHSGATSNNDGTTPGGIIAGYKPGGAATFSGAVNGDVIVDSDATITADAGYGIEAFTWGAGNVTVSTGATSSITAAGTAIRASDHGGGDVSVTNEGTATGAVGLSALATGAGNITIVNDGHLTGTSTTGISVTQNDDNATGATHITNHGYVVGANGHAAIDIQENASDTGIATIDNTGTIGPADATSVASTTYAIVETGGAIAINNSGHINGNISVASATFDNKAAGTWTVSGTSAFGTLSKIDNAGEIDLHDGALVSSADGLTFDITNSGKIESWGTASITGHIANTNTIEIHTGGALSLFGSLSGSGSVTIDAGATLVAGAAVSQTVSFGGTGAELDIDTTDFGGSIAGLTTTDKIDLSSIGYGLGTSAVYVANADASTGGTLTITDAQGHHISLTLTGADYSHAVFAGSDDGTGHTLVTVNAAADAPKFATDTAVLTASFSELANTTSSPTLDPLPAAAGSIAFTDVDLTDRPTTKITHQDVTWLDSDHATQLTLTPDQISALEAALALQLTGKNNGTVGWSYSIADSTLDFLRQDQTATVVSTVTLDDGHKTDTTQITVTIAGANDAPTLSDVTTGPLVDTAATDHFSDLTGKLAGADADTGETATLSYAVLDSHNNAATTVAGHYGALTVNSDGTYDYAPDATAINALSAGSYTDTFTIQTTDVHGATGTATLTVDITGANDTPVISYNLPNHLAFDGTTAVSGAVSTQQTGNGSDGVSLQGWVDWSGKGNAGDSQLLFYNGSTSDAGFGVNGVVTDDGRLDLQIQNGGIPGIDTGITIDADHAHNIALTHVNGQFTLYVDGVVEYTATADVNTIPSDHADFTEIGGVPTEEGNGFATEGFQGSISDISVWNAALTQAQVRANQAATLTGGEDNLVGLFPLHDGSGTTVANLASGGGTLSIHGNAAWADAVPGGVSAAVAETNAGQAVHGTLTVSDADSADHVTVALDHVSAYLDGTLQTDGIDGLSNADLLNYLSVQSGDILNGTTTHADFTWDFNSGSQAFDFLAAGHTLSLQYTIVPNDGHTTGTGGVVTINIAGSNDAPTLDDATLTSVAGGDANPAGTTVSNPFAGKFHDVDDGASFTAIAVSADNVTSDQGSWQYEISGTDQWVDLAGVSEANALVLSTDTLIRFVPSEGFSGTPGTLDVHALDDTYAGAITTTASPATIDITSAGIGHGGTTPVSDQAASISTDVTAPADVLVANDDAIDNATSPSPDAGWVLDSENGHYYRLVSSVLSWGDAKIQAEADGAYLATITDQDEQNIVTKLAAGTRAWLGGGSTDDVGGSSAHFYWLTGPEAGHEVSYTHWRTDTNEPNGGFGTTTQYIHIEGVDNAANGGWNDAPGDAGGRYFIEEWGGQQGQVAFKENTGTTLTTAQLLANDTDSAGNPITVTSVGDLSGHTAHGGTVALDGNIITYTPATDYFGADSFSYTVSDGGMTATATVSFTVDQSPVIDTTHFVHTHNADKSDTLTGLSVSGPSSETYSMSAVTAGASDGSSVSPSQDHGVSLDKINTDLASVTYTPGSTPPVNETIALTVTDSLGAKDTVNFIFNEADAGQGVTLNGTSGKDVIFATTTGDTLSGGGGKDQFVFAPGDDNQGHPSANYSHTITDFIEGLDRIDLRQFSDVSSISNLTIAQQQGSADTLVTWHQQISQSEGPPITENEQLLLKSVIAANLKASDFIFHIT